jgi:hypothetical protein
MNPTLQLQAQQLLMDPERLIADGYTLVEHIAMIQSNLEDWVEGVIKGLAGADIDDLTIAEVDAIRTITTEQVQRLTYTITLHITIDYDHLFAITTKQSTHTHLILI